MSGALLADALARSLRAEIDAYALVVDAKDAAAAAFYWGSLQETDRRVR